MKYAKKICFLYIFTVITKTFLDNLKDLVAAKCQQLSIILTVHYVLYREKK